MMKVKLFYIILLFSIFKAEKSFSQDTIKINLLENYIFVAEISSLIIDSPNSYLYKIKIDSICYYTQNKILENKSDLLKIEYLETNKKLELGSKLILSAYFGYNKYYMILMRTFDLKNYLG
jgi:hypothetical protein